MITAEVGWLVSSREGRWEAQNPDTCHELVIDSHVSAAMLLLSMKTKQGWKGETFGPAALSEFLIPRADCCVKVLLVHTGTSPCRQLSSERSILT